MANKTEYFKALQDYYELTSKESTPSDHPLLAKSLETINSYRSIHKSPKTFLLTMLFHFLNFLISGLLGGIILLWCLQSFLSLPVEITPTSVIGVFIISVVMKFKITVFNI